MHYLTTLIYFFELDSFNEFISKIVKVNSLRLPSEAIFSSELNINTLFDGMPLSCSFSGFAMDVDLSIGVIKAKNGENNKVIEYMLTSGVISSALEHAVPEELFSTNIFSVEGISAVKALQIANDQGIPIYTISQDNLSEVLPKLQINDVIKASITNAVRAGKTVSVSKNNINYNNWNGCGYVISDPDTGAGAYLISGSINGGIIIFKNTDCDQSWEECYTNCINILVPVGPWSVFSKVTLLTNILYSLGGISFTLTIYGSDHVLLPEIMKIPLLSVVADSLVKSGLMYLSWVAGTSYGCMASCGINQCNYYKE